MLGGLVSSLLTCVGFGFLILPGIYLQWHGLSPRC